MDERVIISTGIFKKVLMRFKLRIAIDGFFCSWGVELMDVMFAYCYTKFK